MFDKRLQLTLSFSGAENDPVCVETFRKFWREHLKQGLSVIAFTENPNGGKPIIAGVNVLALASKEENIDVRNFEVFFIYFFYNQRS